jgi:hypothetical protein
MKRAAPLLIGLIVTLLSATFGITASQDIKTGLADKTNPEMV